MHILAETGIGRAVGPLRKSENSDISDLAKVRLILNCGNCFVESNVRMSLYSLLFLSIFIFVRVVRVRQIVT